MAKRESFLSRGDEDDDYWLSSAQISKLKGANLFEDVDDDTIEDDPWLLGTTDVDGFQRVSSARPDSQTFSASSVSGFTGSARYRAPSNLSQSGDDLSDGIDIGQLELSPDDFIPDESKKPKRTSKPASNLSPEAMIKEMLLGRPYQFELYKSSEDKLTLLDAALEARDGNAIIAVILFLKNTFKRSLFNKSIQTRPVALNHYTGYLRAHYDFMELEDTLCMFQKTEDAAMLKYSLAATKSKPLDRVRALQACHRTHFEYEPSLANEGHLLKQHISLLERQLPIEDADLKAILEDTNSALRDHPRRVSTVVNLPLVSTLHYCSLYHYTEPPNYFASPFGMRDSYKLDEREFIWWALKARSVFHDYGAIETLLTSKSWYGGKKLKSVIAWEKVVETLHQSSAPMEVLSKYLKMIDDENTRFQIANKYKCYKVAVDTLIAMKDRRQLESYVAKVLPPASLEYRWAQDALNGTSVKWKN